MIWMGMRGMRRLVRRRGRRGGCQARGWGRRGGNQRNKSKGIRMAYGWDRILGDLHMSKRLERACSEKR